MDLSLLLRKSSEFLKILFQGESLDAKDSPVRHKKESFLSFITGTEELGSAETEKGEKHSGIFSGLFEKEELPPAKSPDSHKIIKEKNIIQSLFEPEKLSLPETVEKTKQERFFSWLLSDEELDKKH